MSCRHAQLASPRRSLSCRCHEGESHAVHAEEGRKEGRKRALATLILSAVVAESSSAQNWSDPFNHNQPHAGNGVFTSPYSPWWNLLNSSAPTPNQTFVGTFPPVASTSFVPANVYYDVPQTPPNPPVTTPVFAFNPDRGWPQPEPLLNWRSFNAVHMAVIPKGPYRGHVLVWNNLECFASVNPPAVPALSPSPPGQVVTQGYQAYAIIDPADAPLHGIRYRNFLVPTGDELILPELPWVLANNMFCAGHAWSPYGDLVVAGATRYELVFPPAPDDPYVGYAGGSLVYVFNPRRTCQWPGTPIEYYPSTMPAGPSADDYRGLWVRAADLAVPRWYPTATLTHRLAREAAHSQIGVFPGTADQERMVFLGGSETVPALVGDRANITYESYVILDECDNQPPNRSKLVPDYYAGPVPFSPSPAQLDRVWDGPGIAMGSLAQDWLYEYPRTFLLSTGALFFCGYAPRGAWLDHDFAPGTWAQVNAQPGTTDYSSNWQDIRHDGSAVLFPSLGGNPDIVLRLGGAEDQMERTTDTVESIAAGNSGSTWLAATAMTPTSLSVPDGGRLFTNLVILPTGDLLLLGGRWQDDFGNFHDTVEPLLFSGGQWSKLPPNPIRSPRTYHSTAVLLPDGRVFLGGGDDRGYDYEIFSPPYLNAPVVRPVNLQWGGTPPSINQSMGAPELLLGQQYALTCDPMPLGHTIEHVTLTAPCSATHHSDMSQRHLQLSGRVVNGHKVVFDMPGDERQAPRGIYMLWLVTNTGTPSEALWVVLR